MIRAFLISILLCLIQVCKAQEAIPSRNVKETDDGVIVTYTFNGGIYRQDSLYPDAKSWTIPGFGQNMRAGEPSVPVRWDTFSVPSGKVASVEILNCTYADTSFVLVPAYPPLLMSDTIGYTRDVVLPIQPYQGLFPNSVVQQSRYQSYRGNRMVKVGIYPIQYDAVNQRVRQYSMIQYKLNFTESPQSEQRETSKKKNSARTSASDNFLKNISLNTPQILSSSQSEIKSSDPQSIYQSTEDTRTFLIITTLSIASGIQEFEEWKWTMGMKVEIRTSNNWTVNGIKQAVQDVYDNDENLYYLLIIGDVEQVPSTNIHFIQDNYKQWDYITDAYYSYLDESWDTTPDIIYGRIPVKTAQEAHSVLDKIIQFEKNPPKDDIYYHNATVCSAFQTDFPFGAYELTQSTEYSEQIRSYLMNGVDDSKSVRRIYTIDTTYTISPESVYPEHWHDGQVIPTELQKPYFTWEGNADSIVDAINAKTFLITGIMEGTENGWSMPTFSVTDTIRLTNQGFYSTIFSMSCKTGKYNFENSDCFAEALLKKTLGGAVAVFAPTHECYYFSSEAQLKGYINSIWPMPGINEFISNASPNTNSVPTYEIGAILQQGFEWLGHEYYIILNDTVYFENETNKYLYQGEIFHCFGDPSMQIYTQTPHSFNNPIVYYRNGSIIAQTQENDVRISFFDIDAADWISKSYIGNYVEFEPDEPEDLVYVCFSKPNYSPYIVKCMKNSAIQNETISDEQHFAAETMKIGTNVVDYIEHGDVLIDGGKVSIRSKAVEIQPNTTIINSEFEVIPTN